MSNLKFSPNELPEAYSMFELAKKTKDPLPAYMCCWSAFNSIYNEIARRTGSYPRYERNRIAQAELAFAPDLKHALIQHSRVEYFVNRTPSYWDVFSESHAGDPEPKGVLNVGTTRRRGGLEWSGISVGLYQRYQEDDLSDAEVDTLVREIVSVLYTVRNNLVHGDKRADSESEREVVRNALPLLSMIVGSFMERRSRRD